MSDLSPYRLLPQWSAESITNPVFEEKFIRCTDIFRDWIEPHLDLTKSTVFEFGCGDGVMLLGICLRLRALRAVGVDVAAPFANLADLARRQLALEELPRSLELHTILPGERLAPRFRADCIFTWSVFEHIHQDYLAAVVDDLIEMLAPGGCIFLQISPLYYSPFGSHLGDVIKEPWAHLLYQDSKLESLFRDAPKVQVSGQVLDYSHDAGYAQFKEGAWRCYRGLNRLTADQVVELFTSHGMRIVREHRTSTPLEPPRSLKRIYTEEALRTEQIALLLQKR